MSKEFNKEATDLIHTHIFEALERIEKNGVRVEKLVEYTNGKVKRLTLALVATAAFAVGLGIVEAKTILSLI